MKEKLNKKTAFWVLVAGLVVGIIMGITVTKAHAATVEPTGMQIVGTDQLDWSTKLFKVYDYDNGVVCYVTTIWTNGGDGGVSCFKN